MDMSAFGRLCYRERVGEYPRSQDIGVRPEAREAMTGHGPVDWSVWERQAAG